MKTDDLRKTYLEFFKSKDHRVFPSDSLVPSDDPSLLFTGAGMNQFKPYFLGLKKDIKRAASCQKCLRAADLDRVGKTAYHHSFFEMLGNFSFGDYFKEEAIAWGWEFVTRVLGLSPSKLWVSVYEADDEAFNIWKNKIGIPESRIVRMGAEDNFWPSNAPKDGPNGPCGPCSEIYVGEIPGQGVEIWNLVFTQFDRQSEGSLKNLPQRNIDTGMGLERTAAVLQGVASNFDTDNFQKIRGELKCFLDKTKYRAQEPSTTAHENAVMDHMRAVIFSIADGALPSNEGRGYVVRKLIRLGCDHFEKAGAAHPGTLHKLVPAIIDVLKTAYPDLVSRKRNISLMIENEERSYLEVIETRIPLFKQELPLSKNPAQVAFKYYDTYGLPSEIINTAATELGIRIDPAIFNALLERQKKRSRESSKIIGEIFSNKGSYRLITGLSDTLFSGYEKTEERATLLRVVKGDRVVDELGPGEEGLLIFNRTPFYAQSGGQVGDTGTVVGNGLQAQILDTQRIDKCSVHRAQIKSGTAKTGGIYDLAVDSKRRADIMKNHTSTHLLHSALRKVLGDHVKQSGSLVAPDRLRFDFTHFSALAPESLAAVEKLVNEQIQKNVLLDKKEMPKAEAIREGAIAFFGEKYGDKVRVVQVGDFSKELCGGTHLDATGQIALFKIVSESSVQAGVRRIEALTGRYALAKQKEEDADIEKMVKEFSAPTKAALPDIIKNLRETIKNRRIDLLVHTMNSLHSRLLPQFEKTACQNGAKIFVQKFQGANVFILNEIFNRLKNSREPLVVLFQGDGLDKVSFAVGASADLVGHGFHSGKIVKEIARAVRGNGGGRADFAVGGGKDLEKIDEAMALGEHLIKESLIKCKS